MSNPKEKYLRVVGVIKSFLELLSGSRTVYLSLNNEEILDISLQEIQGILEGLEGQGYISITNYPISEPPIRDSAYESDSYSYEIRCSDAFLERFGSPEASEYDFDKKAAWVSYEEDMGVVLNDLFPLKKPHAGGENEKVIEFLLAHPNEDHPLEEIEAAINTKLTKNLYDIARGLGFDGDLMKLFFPKRSSDIVHFVNPVMQSHMDARGIKYINLPTNKKSIPAKSEEIA